MENDKTIKEMIDEFHKQPMQYMSLKDAAAMNNAMLPAIPEEQKLSWLSIGDLKALLDYAQYQISRLTPQSSTEDHDYWDNVVYKVNEELRKQIMDIFKPES